MIEFIIIVLISCVTLAIMYYILMSKAFDKLLKKIILKNHTSIVRRSINSKGYLSKNTYCYQCGVSVRQQVYCHNCGKKLIWKE